ncbi:glycosyl transferase [Allorhizobium undicola]|uniref:glycosyl transferase n=1 Tax=Allorhizobium undicola TaxID=78527 RepID=UPI00048000B9|nr:glycosyl transferase [Allorhizobium undicola]
MLTVIFECHNQEYELAQSLTSLVAGAVEGLVSDVVILDHGSDDGTMQLADAAGCRFYQEWTLADVLGSARGQWLLLIEPGARPGRGWMEDLAEYMATGSQPARFAPSRLHRLPLWRRLFARKSPLERGLLLPRAKAVGLAGQGASLQSLAKGLKTRGLASELAPAWAAKAARR